MVSILLILDNYYLNRYAIETMLKNCRETKVELLCINNTNEDSLEKFLNELVTSDKYEHVVNVGVVDELTINKAQAYNKLLKEAKGDFVCVFDSYSIVSRNWLYDLIHYSTLIAKCGCAAIPAFSEKKMYLGLPDKNDEIMNVWVSKDDSVSGIILCSSDILNEGNCFDESKENDFVNEFSLRLASEQWKNFYIPGQITINTRQNA